jgi:serine/threonine protein phosphatase PrpC
MPAELRRWRRDGWTVVAASDRGLVRERQEDTWSVLFSARFAAQTVDAFAVFDGLGGEPRGFEASRAARDNLEGALVVSRGADDVLPNLEKAVDASRGMTTAVVAVFPRARRGNGWVLTAGDSAMYRGAPGGRLLLVAAKDRSEGRITSCLGGGLLTATSTPVQFGAGETFILCTDGVDEVIGRAALTPLCRVPAAELEPQVRSILLQIEQKGAPDNATLIAARYDGPSA